ncbi:MAG: hypothetical protein H0W89_07045 [Candidatus Levybacteria bacterium]|nr:hypothetical protein [Candidatus Levybacteria bacterium]
MRELQTNAREIQGPKEAHVDFDPALKARTRLQELLRPSESATKEIQKRVFAVGEKLLSSHPHAEMQRIVDTASGIFLWEHMASSQEGTSLPLGLTTRIDDDKIQTPVFDNRFLSRDEYAYVFDALDGVLKQSPAAAFFDTFAVTPRREPMQAGTLRDLTDPEADSMHAKLSADFQARYARVINGQPLDLAMATQPGLRASYMQEVTKPMAMATTPGTREDHRPSKETTDAATKESFREYMDTEFFQKRYPLQPGENTKDCVNVENAFFYFKYPTHPSNFHVGDTWLDAVDPALGQLDTSLHTTPSAYARVAVETIGPRLYDRTDTRDSRTIMDEGYHVAATTLYEEIMIHPYSSLTVGEPGENRGLDSIMWLQGADLPLHEDGDPFVEPLGAREQYIPEGQADEESAYSLDYTRRYTIGTITYRNPAIHLEQPHTITRVPRDNDLPIVPERRSDLVVSSSNYSFTSYSSLSLAPDYQDPHIEGYRIIARDDTMTYFVKDATDGKYAPVTNEIPYIKQRAVADFCRELEMTGLADELDTYDRLSVAQLSDILKKYVAYSMPDESEKYDVKDIDDWKTHVEPDGILHGQSELFSEFAVQILSRIYRTKTHYFSDSTLASITSFGDYVLEEDSDRISGYKHHQTHLEVPSENIDAYIDISPPHPALQTALDSSPKTPPPPIKYERPVRTDDDREPYVPPPKPEYSGEYVSITTAEEFKRRLLERAGSIVFVEPVVFETRGQWLFSKTEKDDSLPTPATLDPTVDAHVVLRVKNIGHYLADNLHDPQIAGMKLVARDGDEFDFIIDSESTDHKPVELRIQNQVRNDLAIKFMELGMSGLSWEVKNADDLSIEGLREMVQAYSKYVIPETGGKQLPIERLSDFKEHTLINKDGILEGQCDTFEMFMRFTLQRMYGENAAKAEGGHSLRNVTGISRMLHVQTRLLLPQYGINALIDVEPLDFEGAGIDEGRHAVETHQKRGKRRPIIKVDFSDEERHQFIDDLRSGRALPDLSQYLENDDDDYPEEVPSLSDKHRKEMLDAVDEAPEETQRAFGEALLKSLLRSASKPKEHEPQAEREEPSGLWKRAFARLSLWKPGEDKQKHVMGEDAAWGDLPISFPPPPDVTSIIMDTPEPEPPAQPEKPAYEDPPTIAFAIPTPIAQPESIEPPAPAEMLAEIAVEIPEPQQPSEADVARVEELRVTRRMQGATDAFLMNLSAYLGPQAGRYDDPNFVERVLNLEGRAAAEHDPQRARRILHLQLLTVVDRFRGLEQEEFVETEYTDLSRSIARLQGIMGMYSNQGTGFNRLLQQRQYVDYDEHMLSAMGEAINAYAEWNDLHPREIAHLSTEPDREQLASQAYNSLFHENSEAAFEIESGNQPAPQLQHPNQPQLHNKTYQDSFRPDSTATFDTQTSDHRAPLLPSQTHPDRDRMEDPAYRSNFTQDSKAEFTIESSPAPRPSVPHPEQGRLDDLDYQENFKADSDTTFAIETPTRPEIPTETEIHPEHNRLASDDYNTQFTATTSPTFTPQDTPEQPPQTPSEPQSESERENRRLLTDPNYPAQFKPKK